MDEMHVFARDDVLPSYFENVWERALSVLASNFALERLGTTYVRVPASAGTGAAVIAIQGRPRWSEVNVERVHPGGPGGTYDIYVTASDQNISNTPAPNTDNTNYSFALAIVAAGATPVIVAGTVDIFRKVGSLHWDGAQITQIDPTVDVTVAGVPADGPATQSTLRKLDQTATGATAGNDSRVPTQAENDALQGTSGAPSNGNRYVTDQDPRNANARVPTGAAAGGLTGTYPNPDVAALVGVGSPASGTDFPVTITRAGTFVVLAQPVLVGNVSVGAPVMGAQLLRDGAPIDQSSLQADGPNQGLHLILPLLVWQGHLNAATYNFRVTNGAFTLAGGDACRLVVVRLGA